MTSYFPRYRSYIALLALALLNAAHADRPSNGLVAHWNFDLNVANQAGADPGNDPLDGTIHGEDAAYRNSSNPCAGANSLGLTDENAELFGNSYVSVSGSVLTNYDADHTITAWFKAANAPTDVGSIKPRHVVYESEEFVLSLGLREDTANTANTLIQFFTNISTGSDPRVNISVPDSEIAGKWHHTALVFTRDGSTRTMTAYLDGVERGSTTFTTALDLSPSPSFFNIGTYRSANDRWFLGEIDDIAIWERALEPWEIAQIADPDRFDVNGDGALSVTDLAAVETAVDYDPQNAAYDLNKDGTVNSADVDLINGALVDAGLVTISVTNLDDSGTGSLRQALADANANASPGTHIKFSSGIAGDTITLSSDQLEVADGKEVYIDGGDTSITIDADGSAGSPRRVMLIETGASLALHGLTLTGGRTSDGGGDDGGGGGIFADSNSTLTLTACTVSGNTTGDGGAFGVDGGDGGGIFADSNSILTLTACTVSGNTTGDGGDDGGDGGGIYAKGGFLTISACTVSGNQTGQGFLDTSGGGFHGSPGEGGGLYFFQTTDVTVGDSIIAGNTGDEEDAQFAGGAIDTFLGNNLIGFPNDIVTPDLAPLGDYGGPTMTMPPLTGSPAINGAHTSTATVDQRGFAVVGIPDIGAAEHIPPTATTLTWDDFFLGYGSPLSAAFNATANHPGTITYSRSGTAILNAGSYSTTATFVPDDPVAHAPAEIERSIGIAEGSAGIRADNKTRLVGTPNPALTINGGRDPSDAGFGILPILTTEATIDSPPGEYPITFEVKAADLNYVIGHTNGTLTILPKATPEITWNAPAPITYGTALGASQLNASTNVAGTFSYSPANGTILDAGTRMLEVTFTPADSNAFDSASETVSLVVNKAALTITADHKERAAGAANPTFTATYSGFVNGDTVSDLNTLPTIDSSATPTSIPALWAITVTGGSDNNYEFVRIQGILTVFLDLANLWGTDDDGDGQPWGLEWALGTDPDASDAGHAALPNLRIDSNGRAIITFGYNPEANDDAIWILTRSENAVDYDVELYRYDGNVETFSNNADGEGLDDNLFEIRDRDADEETRYFYRVEVLLRPQT